MEQKCVIGIDVGTSGCKLLAVDDKGRILDSVVEEYPLYAPQPGWSEQEPEDWWQGVVRGLHRLLPQMCIRDSLKAARIQKNILN